MPSADQAMLTAPTLPAPAGAATTTNVGVETTSGQALQKTKLSDVYIERLDSVPSGGDLLDETELFGSLGD